MLKPVLTYIYRVEVLTVHPVIVYAVLEYVILHVVSELEAVTVDG